MITHGHVDVKFAHYGLDFYPSNANYNIDSFAKLLPHAYVILRSH